MPKKSLFCSLTGKCDGNLVLIDSSGMGEETKTRLRCSQCGRITYFQMSIEQFFQLLEEREMNKK